MDFVVRYADKRRKSTSVKAASKAKAVMKVRNQGGVGFAVYRRR